MPVGVQREDLKIPAGNIFSISPEPQASESRDNTPTEMMVVRINVSNSFFDLMKFTEVKKNTERAMMVAV